MAGNHVFEQVGDDHRVWGASVNDLFMDPSGPSRPLGLHQADARGREREREMEGGKGRRGRCKGGGGVMWDREEKLCVSTEVEGCRMGGRMSFA